MDRVLCPCGAQFQVAQWQMRAGKGKYCSRSCMYEYRVRPSGLKYDLKKENPGWIKPGQRLSPDTEFRSGQSSHNHLGDRVGYAALHDWIRRHRGDPGRCEHCGRTELTQWANKSGQYLRDLTDWLSLCVPCHRSYDRSRRGHGREIFEVTATKHYGVRK